MPQDEQADLPQSLRFCCVSPSLPAGGKRVLVYVPPPFRKPQASNEAHQPMVVCVRALFFVHPPPVTLRTREKTKVWDLRTYKEVHSYLTRAPPTDMDISQRGLLSLGFGCHVQVTQLSCNCCSAAATGRHPNQPASQPAGY